MRTMAILFAGLLVWWCSPPAAHAGSLFSDGYLGMTRPELHAKLGQPHKIRTKLAAQRVYQYHTFDEWENVLKEQMATVIGEDVYLYTREKVNVRYSFQFAEEKTPGADAPTLIVALLDIELLSPDLPGSTLESPVSVPHPVPIADLQKLVPEFRPSPSDDAPTFRSNLFVILIQEQASKDARRLVKEPAKAKYDWSLSYRLYTLEELPPRLTLNDEVSRLEFGVDSLQFIKDHSKLTHEAMLNPFSAKAASLPPPAEPGKKKIPRPRYAP